MARESITRGLRVFVLLLTLQDVSPGVLSTSEARTLTDTVIQGFSFKGDGTSFLGTFSPVAAKPTDVASAGRTVAPALAAAVAQAVTQEFPLTSVAPAFTYRYNPTLRVFERSTGVPGPLFSERALTLGEGQLNFSVGYSFIHFSELNGTSLDEVRSPALLFETFRDPVVTPSGLAGFRLSAVRIHTQLDLQAQVIAPSLRYGITENWDIGLTIPIVHAFVRVRNETERVADLNGLLFSASPLVVLDRFGRKIRLNSNTRLRFVQSRLRPGLLSKAAGSATGVGDILLRTKYHLWRTEAGCAAVGLNLQLPSGDVNDFHGTDETHLSTFLYLSQVLWERFEPHLNLGVDVNADAVERSSFVYAAGATFLVGKDLGLMVDFLGRSEFSEFPLHVPPQGKLVGDPLDRAANTCTTAQPCSLRLNAGKVFPVFPIQIKRNDIVDFSFGVRYSVGTAGSVFFGGVVPMNADGFRADFIPSGGIEYSF